MSRKGIYYTIANALCNLSMEEPNPEDLLDLLKSENPEDVEMVRCITKICLSTTCINISDMARITKVTNETNEHLHVVICELEDNVVSDIFDGGENQDFISVARININGDMYTVIFTEIFTSLRMRNRCSYYRSIMSVMTADYFKYLSDALEPYTECCMMLETDDITLSCFDYGLFYAPAVLCEYLEMDPSNDKASSSDTSKLFIKYIKETNSFDNFEWTSLFDDDTFCTLLGVPEYKDLVYNHEEDDEEVDEEDDV